MTSHCGHFRRRRPSQLSCDLGCGLSLGLSVGFAVSRAPCGVRRGGSDLASCSSVLDQGDVWSAAVPRTWPGVFGHRGKGPGIPPVASVLGPSPRGCQSGDSSQVRLVSLGSGSSWNRAQSLALGFPADAATRENPLGVWPSENTTWSSRGCGGSWTVISHLQTVQDPCYCFPFQGFSGVCPSPTSSAPTLC